MLRYLLDESVPHAIARGLKLRGIEVFTATDAALLGQPDHVVLAYALQARLVLFAHDDDYPKLHHAGAEHAGIIYSKQGRRKIGEIIQFLKLASDALDPQDMAGRLEFF